MTSSQELHLQQLNPISREGPILSYCELGLQYIVLWQTIQYFPPIKTLQWLPLHLR